MNALLLQIAMIRTTEIETYNDIMHIVLAYDNTLLGKLRSKLHKKSDLGEAKVTITMLSPPVITCSRHLALDYRVELLCCVSVCLARAKKAADGTRGKLLDLECLLDVVDDVLHTNT